MSCCLSLPEPCAVLCLVINEPVKESITIFLLANFSFQSIPPVGCFFTHYLALFNFIPLLLFALWFSLAVLCSHFFPPSIFIPHFDITFCFWRNQTKLCGIHVKFRALTFPGPKAEGITPCLTGLKKYLNISKLYPEKYLIDLISYCVMEVQVFPVSSFPMTARLEMVFSFCHPHFSHIFPFLCEIF